MWEGRMSQRAVGRGARCRAGNGPGKPGDRPGDANLDLAVEATVSSSLRTAGEECTATKPGVPAEHGDDLVKEKDAELGCRRYLMRRQGWNQESLEGTSLVGGRSICEGFLSYMRKGVEEGHPALRRPGWERKMWRDGYPWRRTVIENVTPDMTMDQEEILGQLLALDPVEDALEDALRLAEDDVPYRG